MMTITADDMGAADGTHQAVRLDFSKPPPGYAIVEDAHGFLFIDGGGDRHESAMHGLGHAWRRDTALTKAWNHFVRGHVPPNMRVDQGADSRWGFSYGGGPNRGGPYMSHADALAVAWDWYTDRLTFVVEMIGRGGPDYWSRCVRWTDEQLAEAVVYMRGGHRVATEIPEVLRA